MPDTKPNAPLPPFSLRLTVEERAQLERAAGSMPLSAYVRARLFDGTATPRRQQLKAPVRDQQALAEVLAQLGRSRIANNLNQLARAANSGSLPVTPDTEAAIREAVSDVATLRRELLRALGLRERVER